MHQAVIAEQVVVLVEDERVDQVLWDVFALVGPPVAIKPASGEVLRACSGNLKGLLVDVAEVGTCQRVVALILARDLELVVGLLGLVSDVAEDNYSLLIVEEVEHACDPHWHH